MIVTPGFRRRALVVALAGIYGMGSQLAQANPTGAQVVNGQAVLQTQGNKLTVTNTPGAIINWQSFSVGAGETTYFQQQNAASAVLNRVQAQNPSLKSQIDGTLGSNGRVFLINPNGIVFGAGSVIDTQGFVASTLNLNDADFKSGKLKFSSQAAAGNIEAKGRISSGNGDVYLVAPNIGVDGNAVITSVGGNIVLAAGEMVEITGRNLNDITFAIQSKDNQVINLGTLSGGAVGVFAGTLSHSGVIKAQTLVNEGGRLVLKAQGHVTLGRNSQTLANGDTLGGTITVESAAGNLALGSGALVSAAALSPARPQHATPRGGDVSLRADAGILSIERDSLVTVAGGRGGNVDARAAYLVQDGAIRADGAATLGGSVSLQAGERLIQSASASVSAQGVLRGGDIRLAVSADPAGSGSLFSSGTLDASAGSGVGGSVTISGRDLTFAAARVVANGDAGGGSVRLGGGLGGLDTSMPNARNVVVSGASSMEASARADGDGGTVVVWADGTNKFAGVVEARGGAQGGNGGFIEVSGKEETQFAGTPNASAPFGRAGTFLLDPKYILIQAPALVAGVSVELLDPNPGNNNLFGQNVDILTGGNLLVRDPLDDFGGISNTGAVYLYNGSTGALISALRGSASGDMVGSGGNVRNLSGGNFILSSPLWGSSAGALTTFNTSTGASGIVSSANSLVGSAPSDQIGSGGISTVSGLGGSKLAIFSPNWSGQKGAISWGDTTAGATGVVSSANSLVGAAANDRVGDDGITSLGSGKYYVNTTAFNASAGAITWIDADNPRTGVVGAANSLVGSTANDQIGSGGITSIGNGKYAVLSPNWSNAGVGNAGAVTWFDVASGTFGAIGPGNSLVGSNVDDRVGNSSLVSLGSNKYYLQTSAWNGFAGAVTFVDSAATSSLLGPLNDTNSLVGFTPGDGIGGGGVYNFGSGYSLVFSPAWSSNTGAVTWFSNTSPTTGFVGAGNSLVGSTPGDLVGGNYWDFAGSKMLIRSPDWHNGTISAAGAMTWVDPGVPMLGAVTTVNSLVGDHIDDRVGDGSFQSLSSGNYYVITSAWNSSAGAVTFINPSLANVTGPISASNSLVGSPGDQVGSAGVDELSNGMIAIRSPNWFNPNTSTASSGAITFANSSTIITGVVDDTNSLVGDHIGDAVGSSPIVSFNNGNYYVQTSSWNGGAGAVTFIDTTLAPRIGAIDSSNSLVGTPGDGIGSGGIYDLGSGYSLVFSQGWSSGKGAVTWFSQTSPTAGFVGAGNSLVGNVAADAVGSNYWDFAGNKMVIRSPDWHNGGISGAGALTWVDPATPFTGAVTIGNSLVGSNIGDRVGDSGFQFLNSGNYYYGNTVWNSSAGAVTFVNPSLPNVVGAVSSANSLVGKPGDRVGSNGIQQLSNGMIAIKSSQWVNPNGSTSQSGAITFADSSTIITGLVDDTNSLVGDHVGDLVGNNNISSLFNGSGKYYVNTPAWNSSGGAVTFIDTSAIPVVGAISASNSVVGKPGDQVGSGGIQELANGMIAIKSPSWFNATTSTNQSGAITFADSFGAITGLVDASNSLVGDHAGDRVGNASLQALGSGFYVANTAAWNTNAGAITFVDTTLSPVTGTLGSGNSLIGNPADQVGGGGIQDLSNGKALVFSPAWGGNKGAVTWFNYAGGGTMGLVDATNSLVGSTGGTLLTGDRVGGSGYQVLGSQIAIKSPNWNNTVAGTTLSGAITLADAVGGIIGPVSAANSLVGDHNSDRVGNSSITLLGGGKYYTTTAAWNGGAGAVTFIDSAATPLSGPVSAGNSLVGGSALDGVGSGGLYDLGAGKMLVFSQNWNGNMGAVTWYDKAAGTYGLVGSGNSLVGSTAGDHVGSGYWNYIGSKIVILSSSWNNGGIAAAAGAMTWADAGVAMTGAVSAGNSLVGSHASDRVGLNSLEFFAAGQSVLRTTTWNGNAGAVTWINNAAPLMGEVGSANSLVGSNTGDLVGNGGFSSFSGTGYNYKLLTSTSWNGSRGAVTWIDPTAPLTGFVSSGNSLVGVNANDRVGNGGINPNGALVGGDYIVSSPQFGGAGIGALTVGSKAGGISGVVSGANSLVGFGGSYIRINGNTRLLVKAPNASSLGFSHNGQVCLYAGGAGCASSLALGSQLYATNPGSSVTITPAQITAITNSGTNVVLQANSDITLDVLSDIVSNNLSGTGGALTLAAGRSVFINSNIITDDGNLTIIGNDRTSNGVSAANRDAGTAVITMANGTLLNAGAGKVTVELRDGAGHSGAGDTAGSINLRSIVAGKLAVKTDLGAIKVGDPDATLPSDIRVTGDAELIASTKILFAGGARGAYAQLSADGQIKIDPPSLEMRTGGSFARIVNPTQRFPIKLTVSECITCVFVSPYEITGSDSSIIDLITASLLSLPNLRDDINGFGDKKSKGSIEIEGGETCN